MSSSSSTASVPNNALASYVQSATGPGLIGSWITVLLYGITCAQVYKYYSEYQKDPLGMKCFIALLSMLITARSMAVCWDLYHYLVTAAYRTDMLIANYWTLTAVVAIYYITAFLCLCFFITKVYYLSRRTWHYIATGFLAILAMTHTALGLVIVGAKLSRFKFVAEDISFSRTLVLPVAVTQVLCDSFLTFMLCNLLGGHEVIYRRTKAMIHAIIVLIIGRGAIIALTACAMLFQVSISPTSAWYDAVSFVLGDLYVNSVLVMLNARNALRDTANKTDLSAFIVAAGDNHGADELGLSNMNTGAIDRELSENKRNSNENINLVHARFPKSGNTQTSSSSLQTVNV